MEELKKELNEEQAADVDGGVFPNMPNPFFNPVTHNDAIYSGEGHVPGESWQSGNALMYMVKSGDTLFNIATAHHVDYSAMMSLNPQIKNSHWIHPRDVIMLSDHYFG